MAGEAIPTEQPAVPREAPQEAPGLPNNPVKMGLDWIQDSYLRGKGADAALPVEKTSGDKMAGDKPLVEGYSREDLKALGKAVDPDDELTLGARTIAVLDAQTRHYLQQKNPAMAAEAAGKTLAGLNTQAQALGRRALQAYAKGDMDGVAKFVSRAYNLVPDGKHIEMKTGEDGQPHAFVHDPKTNSTEDMGPVTPQQVAQLAKGLAFGTEYYNRLSHIASGNRSPPKPQQTPDELATTAAVRKYVGQDYEGRIEPLRKGIDDRFKESDATKAGEHAGGSIDELITRAAKEKGDNPEKELAKARVVVERLADRIAQSGYRGDPRILSEFAVNAIYAPQQTVQVKKGANGSLIAQYKDQMIPIDPATWREIALARGLQFEAAGARESARQKKEQQGKDERSAQQSFDDFSKRERSKGFAPTPGAGRAVSGHEKITEGLRSRGSMWERDKDGNPKRAIP